jgi:hypothetical protein
MGSNLTSICSCVRGSNYGNNDRDEVATNKLKKTKQTRRALPKVTWTHVWPLNETRGAFLKSLFSTLPPEIILQIFRSLSVRDLGNVSLVCRSFKMIADQDEIWKSKFNSRYTISYHPSLSFRYKNSAD